MNLQLRVASSVLGISILAGCGTAPGSTTATAPSATLVPSGWTRLVLRTNSTVVLMHPSEWHEVKSDFITQGPSASLEYLTNQRTVKQCHTSHTRETIAYTCVPPVTQLRPGGVLVTIGGVFLFAGSGSLTNTTVDAHPADVRTIREPAPDSSECPAGATGLDVMNVVLHDAAPANPKSRWSLYVHACFAASRHGGASPQVAIDKMIRSATFPG